MFKGAIDNIHPQRVGGWIYSSLKNVRGSEILAFVDSDCVGSGRVEVFRQDLADADLGDGYLGFNFPISLKKISDISRVVVRMSDSDFVLMPPSARIASPSRFDRFALLPYNTPSIEFMRTKGWLVDTELTFVKFVHDLGVFDLSLVRSKSEQLQGACRLFEPRDLASEYLGLITLREARAREIELSSPSAEEIISAVISAGSMPYPLIALLSNETSTIELVEGTHRDEILPDLLAGAVEHTIGPDRLVFINLLCKFHIRYDCLESKIRAYTLFEP